MMFSLAQIVPSLLKEAKPAPEMLEQAIISGWGRIATGALGSFAVPQHVFGATLVVAVPDSTWKTELEQMSSMLLFRLNSVLGQGLIQYIEFQVHPEVVLSRSRQEVCEVEPRCQISEVPADIKAAANQIADENLREKFTVAASMYLTHT